MSKHYFHCSYRQRSCGGFLRHIRTRYTRNAVKPNPTGPPIRQEISRERRLFLVLGAFALIYAFLAGFRTVGDLDTGWQMATGRWVVQHHQVPSVDVLSYTAQGEHWVYPVGAGVVFYLAFMLGGWALLSWMSAAACAGTVAVLLRRGSAVSAAIAILAVPLIAERTPPRADMFSVVFFAAFLSILWQYYQTSRASLWLLPLLMVVWVNVHFGFAAGLGLLVAYVGTEILEFVCGQARRHAAVQRLRRAWPWLAATGVATLANAWGWGIYRALLLQERANAEQQRWIAEWKGVRLNWPTARAAFTVGGSRSALFSLLAVAMIAGLIALFRAQLGAAILLLASSYAPFRHIRMGAVFACVVVVIAGPILFDAVTRAGSWIRKPRLRLALAGAAAVCFAVLAYARSVELVTDRFYFGRTPQISTFGTGLSWWFPQRAAEFVEREHLPGEIFNTYDEGGYLTLRLGPERRDYIDGRDTLFGLPRVERHRQLLKSAPDARIWEEEADRYHINTILLSRGDGMQQGRLKDFCASETWRPVYLDQVSAVFVRRTPETEALIQRFPIDCATAPLPLQAESGSRADDFASWLNAAGVLEILGRNLDAISASDRALHLFPGSVDAHMLRAGALARLDRRAEAEKELLTATELAPTEYTWSALADFYQRQDRAGEALAAGRKAAELQADPSLTLLQLAYYALNTGHPDDALQAFNDAVRFASADDKKATGRNSFLYHVATGRAEAWRNMGDTKRATQFQEEAVQLAPNARQPWLNLAQIYELQGRSADADRAKARAASLANSENP